MRRLKDIAYLIVVLALIAMTVGIDRPLLPATEPKLTSAEPPEQNPPYPTYEELFEGPYPAKRLAPWRESGPDLRVAGLQLGLSRGVVEAQLGGLLAPRGQLHHGGAKSFSACGECGLGVEILPYEGCQVHGEEKLLHLGLDKYGYVDFISGFPLEVDGVFVGRGYTLREVERLLDLPEGESQDGSSTYRLTGGDVLTLCLEGGKVDFARVSDGRSP